MFAAHPNASASGAAGAIGVLLAYILSATGVDLPPAAAGAIPTALSVLALILPGPKKKAAHSATPSPIKTPPRTRRRTR